jgi:hypothetical protein
MKLCSRRELGLLFWCFIGQYFCVRDNFGFIFGICASAASIGSNDSQCGA